MKTYKPNNDFFALLTALFGVLISILSVYMIKTEIKIQYWDLAIIIIGLIIIAFGLFCLRSFFLRTTVYIFTDFIDIQKGMFADKIRIQKNCMKSWYEKKLFTNKYAGNKLFLFTNSKPLIFYSKEYDLFGDLKSDLIANLPENKNFNDAFSTKKLRIFSIITMILGLLLFSFLANSSSEIENINNYVEIKQVVTSPVFIIKGSKGHKSIDLTFADYPEFKFSIESDVFKIANSEEFIKDNKTGDTLNFYINSNDFDKKIQKNKSLSFSDEHFGYYRIPIYGARKSNVFYLKLDDCLKEVQSDKDTNKMIYYFVAIFLFFGGIATYANNQN